MISGNRVFFDHIHPCRIEKLRRVFQVYLFPNAHVEKIRIDVPIKFEFAQDM